MTIEKTKFSNKGVNSLVNLRHQVLFLFLPATPARRGGAGEGKFSILPS